MPTNAASKKQLNVMVLAGGPDRERPVSLLSGGTVTAALTDAGHNVRQLDISPDDLSALDQFAAWPGDVIFPMLHGSWGEGGGLQSILEAKRLPHVGCRTDAATLCMDKVKTKERLVEHKLPTPEFQVITTGKRRTLEPPLVLKAVREGSSIDLVICRDVGDFSRARSRLSRRHDSLLAEKYIKGFEITVGVIEGPLGLEALPPIHIVPATEYYDYAAKYDRDDTQYLFDIDLPKSILDEIKRLAVEAATVLGCRHMCRVDFMVDHAPRPYILEVNTIPGFTSHSLLPKAAARAGIPLPKLVDQLARLALKN